MIQRVIQRVSIHGGHSGQFCSHAQDTLEEIIEQYLAQGFGWVGITEHMPPTTLENMNMEEKEEGLTVAHLDQRFGDYMAEARRLQQKYKDRLEIFVAFETEAFPGAMDKALALRDQYNPDYILGSVHHLDGISFDANPDLYQQAVRAAGGLEALYCRYFDLQYDLIQRIRPRVVGHFDIVRIFDRDYAQRLALPTVQERIQRNLELIRQMDLILDFNVAAIRKGAGEPYISRPILIQAREMGIAVVPSDDSHGIDTAGAYIDEGIRILNELGFDTNWRRPV
jgi:histidinol-phosphatase (PHP family)